MNKNGMFRMMLAGVALLSLLTLLAGCGSGGDSGGAAGTTATITLEASGSTIPADGTSSVVIKATIKDSAGNPVRHFTDVTFTTTLGHFKNGSTSYTMQTQPPLGENGLPDIKAAPTGIAEVTFTGGHTGGPAKITASSIGVSQSVYVAVTGGSAGITLTASPTTIPADGKSSTTITATLTDSSGSPVKPGTEVTFTTGLGHFLSDTKSYTVSTPDTTGIVKVSLHAGLVPGTTYVVATSNGISQDIAIVFIRNGRSSISIVANPFSIPADGFSTSTITATVEDLEGNGIANVPVTFYDVSNVDPEPLPPQNTFEGNGPEVTSTFYTNGGLTTFTMSYQGTSNFIIWLWNKDTSTREDLLVNEIGSVEKAIAVLNLNAGNYFFEVKNANADWSIKIDGDIGPTPTPLDAIVLSITETDSNGAANYTYTSTTKTGNIRIKAETGEVSNSEEALSKEVIITQTGLSPTDIDLVAEPSRIYANGESTTTISANVTDMNGNKVADGTVVNFSATSGTIDARAQTFDGIASAVLTSVVSATSITSSITATVNGLSDQTTVAFTGVSLTDMQANPATIFANGTDTSEISVRIRDANGLAVEGETVTFTSTSGSIQTATATTGSDGVAKTNLIAPTNAGTAMVTAAYGLITATTTVNFSTQVLVGTITLVANPTSIPADGASSSIITATLKDTAGAAVPTGTAVIFTTDLGTFGGSGTQTYTVITPNETGVVSVSLIASSTAGSAKVTATSGGVSQNVYVTMGGSSVFITLTADPSTIPADGSSASNITATLVDAAGKPVKPGTSVNFTTTLGTFSNGSGSMTMTTQDETGVVMTSLISATSPGTATVTAMSGGVSQSIQVEFTGAGEVGSIEVSANPTSILADGISTSTITALVKTTDNQVIEGASVTFATTRGAITSPHVSDANGQAKATLTSERYFDSSVKVTASCQGKEAFTFVQFTGVNLTLTAAPETLLVSDSKGSLITATLKDAAGNPIANAAITFTTDKGIITPAIPQMSNSAGQALVTLTSNVSGIATVTAGALGAEGKVSVNFTRYDFRLEADPTTIRVGGETSQITVLLLDQGVPKANETVNFSSTLGTLNSYQQITGADGKAVVTLTSGTQSGIAIVDATTTITSVTPPIDLSATTQVVITGGTAAKIVLTANPDIVTTNTGVSTITAAVYDANDQPAPDQKIYFRINTGPGGGESLSASVKTTNSFGMATVTFYAGSLASTLKGVEIEANTATDFNGSYGLANLTIAGPVASIGVGMNLETLEPDGGNLRIDVSGIATDVNGNPVADGTKIYFAVTAIEFDEDRDNDLTINCWDDNRNPLTPCPPVGTPGFGFTWFSDDVNQDGTMYSLGGPMCTTEDVNHNWILDPGEDKNDNTVIDPIQGCVINDEVGTTDGVAKTTLVYPMPQANNIKVKITAEAGGVSNFYETILLCTEKMVEQGTCGIAY